MAPEPETLALRRAREEFLTGSRLAPQVRPDILSSWRRSSMSGATPEVSSLPYSDALHLDGLLYEAAEPVLARLAERLNGTRTAMLLADPGARILARWVGDDALLTTMDRTESAPGFALVEEACGTNGLGSVVEERRPFFVVGSEHFAERFVDYACYGAPIRHPVTGRLQGVLTFVCRAQDSSPLMLAFVEETCEAVQERMQTRISLRERRLLDAFVNARRAPHRAVLAVSEQTVISSPSASRLLNGADQAPLWEAAARAIDTRRPGDDTWTAGDDRTLAIHTRPVLDGDRPIGALVEMAPLEPARREAVRPAAGTASVQRPQHPQQRLLRALGGTSRAWTHAISVAARAVGSTEPVLITGEAGTGKLELARALHELGAGADGGPDGDPDGGCRVLSAALAPVDGVAGWLGRVREHLTGDGTLVLTHLEALSEPAPLALAALLDDTAAGARPRLVGTVTTEPGGAAPTGPHLQRLGVHRVELPPLRERGEDIRALAERLLYRHAGGRLRLGSSALQAVLRAPWPGNVRQLDLVVRTVAAEHPGGTVGMEDLPADLLGSARRGLTQMERLELYAIVGALRKAGGNKRLAAADLGISRSTLYRRLRAFHLDLDRTAY